MNLMDQSLCLLDGVSNESEIRLRRKGILTCSQLVDNAKSYFSAPHAARIQNSWQAFRKAKGLELIDWFVMHLPLGQRVRAISDYLSETLFFDIETDCISRNSHITCITTLRDGNIRTYIRGRNLLDFMDEWASARLIVGFNSKRFDTPMVCREFGVHCHAAQIDLMDEAGHYGLRGGLKSIEKYIGFIREDNDCLNGNDAIYQWSLFCKGDETALMKLIKYNVDDVLSLRHLYQYLLSVSLENF